MRRFAAMVGAWVLLLGVPPGVAAEDYFYRYENGEGVTVIDDNVPAEFAHKGYAVLNKYGRVVEQVARTLTDEELRSSGSSLIQERLRAEEAVRQKRYDDVLLRRYSAVADIEAARVRKIGEIQLRISSMNGTVSGLSAKVDERQNAAAELEREGQPVPPQLTRDIASLRAEIATAEMQIAKYEAELKTTEARYSYDKERFRVIKPEVPPAPEPVWKPNPAR